MAPTAVGDHRAAESEMAVEAASVAVRSEQLVSSGLWVELAEHELAAWNDRLLLTEASLTQYPYWNEPYRMSRLRPRYIAWNAGGRWVAYACVLTADLPGFRIGLVFRGPVNLLPGQELPNAVLRGLYRWAKQKRYAFLRFTHAGPGLLNAIAALGHSQPRDAFPFFEDMGAAYHELVVDQLQYDGAMLAEFDREARRKICRAEEAGYTIQFDDRPETLASNWGTFLECSRRRQFHFHRGLEHYLKLLELARPHNCARVYTASLNGRALAASLVVRDRDTAFCYLAALDVSGLEGRPTPAFLLHWRAMRDLYKVGVCHYNFGPGTGKVGFFKQQFSPRTITYPPPVTLVTNRFLYALWCAVLPGLRRAWPAVKPLAWSVAKLLQSSSGRISE
ncbi:MAG: lipid II:glycine glycyltransferase FemX [Terriglobales bacterium]